jgi:hypothetical protein
MGKKFILAIIYFVRFQSFLFSQETKQYLLSDSFKELNQSWNRLLFDENISGRIEIVNGNLIIMGTSALFGIYYNSTVKGHFIVDLEFGADQNVGLALIQKKAGKPDLNNYTMLCVDAKNNLTSVYVQDRQKGIDNVLDFSGKTNFEIDIDEKDEKVNIGHDLYKHVLTGKQYSVPFTETNKKIRIFREENSGFFHYYYQVSSVYNGQKYIDWMELRPSPDWAKQSTEYYIALLSLHEGETLIKSVKAQKKPMKDKDDKSTGFQVTKREYNWSGFIGDANVITFDNNFLFQERDIKFVFWTEMNYIPAWHLNNQLLYTYEFVETWDEDTPGCHEPMSDRLRQWTWVKVLEDNPVRKVLQWHYVLCNPNYEVPAQGRGKQLPEVDEYWTFYPDGSGIRHIIYTPKLDTDFRAAHELGEMISIAGSKSHSSDFYDTPALTMMNLEGETKQAHPGPKFDYYSDIDDWKQQILMVHFKDNPDVFCVWSHDPQIPETWSGYPIRYENAWQNPNGKIVHWPVNKRPYTSAYSSGGTWKAEVSHACLLSWGVRDGIEWKDHYKINANGRKYREWISLIGLNEQNNKTELYTRARSWLFIGEIKFNSVGCEFLKKDYNKNSFIFKTNQNIIDIEFRFIPEKQNTKIINPAIIIKNWGNGIDLQLSIDDIPLNTDLYRFTKINENDILIWLNTWLGPDHVVKIEKY